MTNRCKFNFCWLLIPRVKSGCPVSSWNNLHPVACWWCLCCLWELPSAMAMPCCTLARSWPWRPAWWADWRWDWILRGLRSATLTDTRGGRQSECWCPPRGKWVPAQTQSPVWRRQVAWMLDNLFDYQLTVYSIEIVINIKSFILLLLTERSSIN